MFFQVENSIFDMQCRTCGRLLMTELTVPRAPLPGSLPAGHTAALAARLSNDLTTGSTTGRIAARHPAPRYEQRVLAGAASVPRWDLAAAYPILVWL